MAIEIEGRSPEPEILPQILDALARVCAAGFGEIRVCVRDGKPDTLQESVSRSLHRKPRGPRRVIGGKIN